MGDQIKKRLIVDMDGVLADVYAQFARFELEDSGTSIDITTIEGIDEIKAFPNGIKHVHERGFFRTAPVLKGAVEAMELLNKTHEVFIVSAAMEFPNSLEEKYYWLQEHFPFIHWKQMVLCGSKNVIQGDIMIDDHFKNLDHFRGRTLLFTQPHNVKHTTHNHERIYNWNEILDKLS